MATFVMAHGDRIDGEPKTFVPEGTTIKFFGADGEYLATTNALAAVASGGGGTPTEEKGAGEEIWNYHLYKEDDRGIAQYMTVDPGGSTMVFCGPDFPNDTPLCNKVVECKSAGAHSCTGVLGRYAGELIVLACRGVEGVDTTATRQLGGDASDPNADVRDEMIAWVGEFLGRAASDPDAAELEYDGLPEGTKAMLSGYPSIMAWSQARWVRWYAGQDDLQGFIGQLTNGAPAPKDKLEYWFRTVQVYGDSLLYLLYSVARAVAEAMLETARTGGDEGEFDEELKELEQAMAPTIKQIEQVLGTTDLESRLHTYQPMVDLKASVIQQMLAIQAQGAGAETT